MVLGDVVGEGLALLVGEVAERGLVVHVHRDAVKRTVAARDVQGLDVHRSPGAHRHLSEHPRVDVLRADGVGQRLVVCGVVPRHHVLVTGMVSLDDYRPVTAGEVVLLVHPPGVVGEVLRPVLVVGPVQSDVRRRSSVALRRGDVAHQPLGDLLVALARLAEVMVHVVIELGVVVLHRHRAVQRQLRVALDHASIRHPSRKVGVQRQLLVVHRGLVRRQDVLAVVGRPGAVVEVLPRSAGAVALTDAGVLLVDVLLTIFALRLVVLRAVTAASVRVVDVSEMDLVRVEGDRAVVEARALDDVAVDDAVVPLVLEPLDERLGDVALAGVHLHRARHRLIEARPAVGVLGVVLIAHLAIALGQGAWRRHALPALLGVVLLVVGELGVVLHGVAEDVPVECVLVGEVRGTLHVQSRVEQARVGPVGRREALRDVVERGEVGAQQLVGLRAAMPPSGACEVLVGVGVRGMQRTLLIIDVASAVEPRVVELVVGVVRVGQTLVERSLLRLVRPLLAIGALHRGVVGPFDAKALGVLPHRVGDAATAVVGVHVDA